MKVRTAYREGKGIAFLLSAAAQSVYAKRKQFTRGAPKEAKAYLETLLLGQTEVGSYIVNVIAPTQQNVGAGAVTAEAVPPRKPLP
jgi:hypothetical protein